MKPSKKYDKTLRNLTGISNQINKINSQLLLGEEQRRGILDSFKGLQLDLSTLRNINSHLPKLTELGLSRSMLGITREVTTSLSNLNRSILTEEITSTFAKYSDAWASNMLKESSIIASKAEEIKKTFAPSLLGLESFSKLSVQSSILKATELSVLAEKSLSSFKLTDIGNKINMLADSRHIFQSSFSNVFNGYSTLIKSFEANPSSYTGLHPSLIRQPPIEYYNSANLVESISVDEKISKEDEILINDIQYENEISLEKYLPKINPKFYNIWKGAIEAYHSNNSDKVRHFSASIRELFMHLIHQLAPDDEVKLWTTDNSQYKDGRPTRRARLQYICKNIDNNSFRRFVRKDVDATLEFIDIFQKGTHAIDPNFTPHQMTAIKSKAESTLKFLLDVHFNTN